MGENSVLDCTTTVHANSNDYKKSMPLYRIFVLFYEIYNVPSFVVQPVRY